MIQKRNCISCHSVQGGGGQSAPDLSRRSTRDFSPAVMAALMWNHGPAMWRAMAAKGEKVPSLSESEAADLYTYFYSIRYFDIPGDAGRGKVVFTRKKCSTCHSLTPADGQKAGPAVSQWPAIANRIRWTQQMWNHSGTMLAEMKKKGISWPSFTVQEMVDLLVYVRNLPNRPEQQPSVIFEDPVAGEGVFQARGCAHCHTIGAAEAGKVDLVGAARSARTFTELGALMWNHAPQMQKRAAEAKVEFPTFTENEMSQLIAYLFAKRYFEEKGSPSHGKSVFTAKKCATCHDQTASGGAPRLQQPGRQFSAQQMASAAWRHGPTMLSEMEKRNISWPSFAGTEMADLIAYLNSH